MTERNNNIVDQVKTMRDELKVKTHLFKMDAKDKWNDLERQYEKATNKFEKAAATVGDTTEGVIATNKLAFEKIKDGYEQIKNDLK